MKSFRVIATLGRAESRASHRVMRGSVLLFVLSGLSVPSAHADSFSSSSFLLSAGERVGATSGTGSCEVTKETTTNRKTSLAFASTLPGKCKFGAGSASAAVNLVTGIVSLGSKADTKPHEEGVGAGAGVNFDVNGEILLPPGMTSARLGFGTEGLTLFQAFVPGSPAARADATGEIQIATPSGPTSACLAVGNGAVPPFQTCTGGNLMVSTTVYNGELITLSANFGVSANATLGGGVLSASAESNLSDPLFLSLPAGAQFVSSVPGFLSGATTVPEPSSALLLGSGLLLSMVLLRKRWFG